MKIVKNAINDLFPLEISCTGIGNGGNGCKSILHVDKSDLYYYDGEGRIYGSEESSVGFVCPICTKQTDLSKNLFDLLKGMKKDFSSISDAREKSKRYMLSVKNGDLSNV